MAIDDVDQPRGKVAELVRVLGELGLTVPAEQIVRDILLRRRDRIVGESSARKEGSKGQPYNENASSDDDDGELFEEAEVIPVEENSAVPLSDEEQILLALRMVELLIVNPLQMTADAAQLTAKLAVDAAETEPKKEATIQQVPYLQLGEDRVPIPVVSADLPRLGSELKARMNELALWLRSP